ncbi:3-methyladenine DNA glycosylase [Oryzobacter sp. R7]|uniref:3-methyladenine DNA glycosylase n=1 Tax=Oryzobacter faecalis TaxID=3388656 RepID=UPI00398CB5CC
MSGTILPLSDWQALEGSHAARVDGATAPHRARRADGRAHPVEDFLFRYYDHTPAQLRRWHPGPGVVLQGAASLPRAGWRHYRVAGDGVELDVEAFLASRGSAVSFVHSLLSATLERPPQLGCFGLHEWAMVYRTAEDDVRHAGWPLRLGAAGTDEVVERHGIRCSHFDAFRFFTDEARPRNALRPSREGQLALEQPGCLHAGMDVYKWAFKLTPLVPSDLVADAFDLAREIRVLDMEASPYDLRELGYEPVAIETAEGKVAYLRRQRAFAERSNALRRRLLDVLGSCAEVAARETT